MCENKSFVAKEHLVCDFTTFFFSLVLRKNLFHRKKCVMWPEAVVGDVQWSRKGEGKSSDCNFLFGIDLIGLWLPGLGSLGLVPSSCACTVSFQGQNQCQSSSRTGEASAGRLCYLQANQVSFFISAHGNGMVNLYDMVVTTESCEDDGCHKSPYRAVCHRWLQTQHKAKCVCKWGNCALRASGCMAAKLQLSRLKMHPSAVLHRVFQTCLALHSDQEVGLHCPDWCCRPCTTWPTRFASAPQSQAPLLPVLTTKVPKTNPFWGAGSHSAQGLQEQIVLI